MKSRISKYCTRPDYDRDLDSYFVPPQTLSVSLLHPTTQILEINPLLVIMRSNCRRTREIDFCVPVA